jgi:hypothetical protein
MISLCDIIVLSRILQAIQCCVVCPCCVYILCTQALVVCQCMQLKASRVTHELIVSCPPPPPPHHTLSPPTDRAGSGPKAKRVKPSKQEALEAAQDKQARLADAAARQDKVRDRAGRAAIMCCRSKHPQQH